MGLLCATFLSGCTATTIDTQGLAPISNTQFDVEDFGFADASAVPTPEARPQDPTVSAATALNAETPAENALVNQAGATDPAADSVVASAPQSEMVAPTAPGLQSLDGQAAADGATQRILQANNAPSAPTEPTQLAAIAPAAVAPAATPVPAQASPAAAAPVVASVPVAPVAASAAAVAAPKRTGIFRSLFNRERVSPPAKVQQASLTAPTQVAATPNQRVISTVSASSNALPGVDKERVLGIARSTDDNRPSVEVASAAGLARLTPNGLKTQHSGVDVKCLKPALVRMLKQVESKYGKPVIVTSGYRSPARNKAARGAKNSLHMYCAAADIQVDGVDKWALASYLRSVQGRGGVGTYCHTKSVHIDIGPKRDWNARCRRR